MPGTVIPSEDTTGSHTDGPLPLGAGCWHREGRPAETCKWHGQSGECHQGDSGQSRGSRNVCSEDSPRRWGCQRRKGGAHPGPGLCGAGRPFTCYGRFWEDRANQALSGRCGLEQRAPLAARSARGTLGRLAHLCDGIPLHGPWASVSPLDRVNEHIWVGSVSAQICRTSPQPLFSRSGDTSSTREPRLPDHLSGGDPDISFLTPHVCEATFVLCLPSTAQDRAPLRG